MTNNSVAIANDVNYQAWTDGGTLPGPIIHVRQGQTVNVTLTKRHPELRTVATLFCDEGEKYLRRGYSVIVNAGHFA